MAEVNEYVLTIRNETQGGIAAEIGGAGGIQTSAGSGDSSGGESSGGLSEGGKQALKKVLSVYRPVKTVANQIVSYQVSQVQVTTGSREAQQRANMLYSIGSSVVNTAENVALGAAFGNLPGAVIALALSAVSQVIGIVQKREAVQNQKRLEDITRDLSAQRATVSGSRYTNATEF